jgi:dihydroneopterin aldolase
MKKNNFKIVKIDKNKSLFNYEKKILIKELTLDLKLGIMNLKKRNLKKLNLALRLIMRIKNQQVIKI